MQFKLLKLYAIFLLAFGLNEVQAQGSINTTGGNASGNGGSASYSIGQIVYQMHTGTNGSIAEGVQQPYEISLVTDVGETQQLNHWVTVYPNPTTNKITLKINDLNLSGSSFELYDMTGKLLLSDKIPGNQTSIVLGNLMAGMYFLKVIREGDGMAIIKIIKR